MANDFSGDDRFMAVWPFDESLDDVIDSLTFVASDTVDYSEVRQEGSHSLSLWDMYVSILDSNLPAGFPLKSGDTVKKGTWFGWIYPRQRSNASINRYIVCKYDSEPGKRSLGFCTRNSKFNILWGYNSGDSVEQHDTGVTAALDEWWHFALRFDGVNKTLNLRLYRLSTDTVQNVSLSPANELYAPDTQFLLSSKETPALDVYTRCLHDEFGVADDLLTDEEIDQIRAGTYGAPATNIKSINGVAYASLKSINGVARANMKSWNGVA